MPVRKTARPLVELPVRDRATGDVTLVVETGRAVSTVSGGTPWSGNTSAKRYERDT